MTEEVNKEAVEAVEAEEVKAAEPQAEETKEKEEKKDGPQVLEPLKASASPFISEEDIIELKVRYYVRGVKYFVENVDEDFSEKDVTNEFTFICRIPKQEDVSIISQIVGVSPSSGEMSMFKVFSDMEYVRLVRLIKSWSLNEPCTEGSIENMHPEIVKGMIVALRNKIDMTAIV